MGKLGPRLASRKKAKRWAKGQSASSNPETTKHREKAAWMFFKDITGTSGLTKEELQKHDAMQSIQPQLERLEIDEDQPESSCDGTVNTFDTFASNYSNCSNISFNRFLSHFQSTSILHKEMLAVLSAVTEVIKQNGGNESSTEYFAALMSTLEAIETETSIAATLSLLGMGLKTVPSNVLNVQFGAASQVFIQILVKHASTEQYLILRHCIGCLSVLLRAQEMAQWSNTSTMQALNAVLSFTTHSKPKVRKSAQHGICAILKGSVIMKSENPPVYHPGAPEVAKHCIAQLDAACEPGGITTVLHTLTLLKDVTHQLPKSSVKTICEGLLRIMGLKNVLVTSCCLQAFHGLFVSRPPETILPSLRNAQIITALYDYQPPANDTQPTLAWLAVMQEAYCNIAKNSLQLSAGIVPRMINKCVELWLTNKAEVISGASHTIKTLLQECVAPLCENVDKAKQYNNTLDQVILHMHQTLSYQYLEAWHHAFHLIALMFKVMGNTTQKKLMNVLKALTELRESHNFSYCNDAEYAIGAAVKAMGPQIVLDVIPLRKNDKEVNIHRMWMLPILKDCMAHGSLLFFMETLYPLITICEEKAKEPIAGKTYELLISQLWSILPSLCNDANDVKQNFQKLAKMLGTIIRDQKDLRSSAMAALRKLIAKSVGKDNEDDKAEVARFAKNYLPILFNLYTTKPNGTDEEGQRLAALETIKMYLTITDKVLVDELFDRALNKMNEENVDTFFKDSVQDLIRIMIEYTDINRLKRFYDMSMPFLKDKTKHKEQKKAYRFLEELTGSEKEVCKEFVSQNRKEMQKALTSSTATVHRMSKGARLRCLMHLVKVHPSLEKTKFLQAIVPEAVLCIKDINERSRISAYHLLNVIADKFRENPEQLKDYTKMLLVGIDGSQEYCNASMLALASITYHHNDALGTDAIKEILQQACMIIQNPVRDIVESALSYIKVYFTVMPSSIVASTLANIVGAITHMTEDCKRHFRQKIRDLFTKLIRKYSYGTIFALIPASDAILRKRLKNINKVEEAKKKNRELKKQRQAEEDTDNEFNAKRRPKSMEEILADSEEEFDETESEEPKKHRKRTSRKEAWIQENEENITDLIDPAAARNITTTLPGTQHPKLQTVEKTKDHGFKTAPDGRLIITDDNEPDSETEKTGRRKKKSLIPQSDSEDNHEDMDDDVKPVATAKSTPQKRKHSESDAMSLRSEATLKYQAGGSGIHRPLKKNKAEYIPGSEYRSQKAKGDIKKKGKPDPYAYVPLTRASLNKRKKKKNVGKFENIISGATKGAKAKFKKQ